MNMKEALLKESAKGFIVAPYMGFVNTDLGGQIAVDYSFLTSSSVLFDAVYIPGGKRQDAMSDDTDVLDFINDAYKHCKVIGTEGEGIKVLAATNFAGKLNENIDGGIIMAHNNHDEKFASDFIAAMGKHRFWEREKNV
jgi:catalase